MAARAVHVIGVLRKRDPDEPGYENGPGSSGISFRPVRRNC